MKKIPDWFETGWGFFCFQAFLRAFTKKLQGGTQTALKSVKELVKGIKGWLDDKMPGWKKGTDELDDIGRDF